MPLDFSLSARDFGARVCFASLLRRVSLLLLLRPSFLMSDAPTLGRKILFISSGSGLFYCSSSIESFVGILIFFHTARFIR